MKSIFITMSILLAFILTPVLVNAQTDQPATASPPLSQPLVREGTLATKLVDALKVGSPKNEAEAESMLSQAGIAPRNGWIADYPVTPDIVGELQTSVSQAAESGRLSMSKDAALKTYDDVIAGYNLSVKAGTSGEGSGETVAPTYPESEVENNYYYNEGPPVVTYYAPPPDYAYLYSWVPYPFWWWNFWFPGFFVLADFDIDIHGHGHGHRHGHEHGEFISNHFRDRETGRFSRIDPANRWHGGTFADRGVRWNSPSVQRSAAAIFNRSSSVAAASGRRMFGSPSVSGRTMSRSSRNSTFVSPSGVRRAMSGSPSVRTYSGSSYSRGGALSQPAYKQGSFGSPSLRNRSFTAPSGSWRGFSAPSAGSRTFNAPSAGGGRGSFGGMGRR